MIHHSFARLWNYLDRPAKTIALLSVLCTVVSSAFEALGVGGLVLVMRLVDDTEQTLAYPIISDVQNHIGVSDPVLFSVLVCLFVALFYILKNCMLLFTSWLQARFGAAARMLVTRRLMGWYLHRPYLSHLRDTPTALVHLMTDSSEDGLLQGIVPALVLFTETLAIASILTIAILFYPVETLVFVLLLGIIPGCFYVFVVHRRSRRIGRDGHQARQRLHTALFHSFSNLKEIRAAEKEGFFLHRFDLLMDRCTSLRAMEMLSLKVMPPLVESFIAIALITAAITAIIHDNGMGSSLPMLTLFGAAGLRVLPSIFRMAQALQLLAVADAPLKAVLDEMDKARRFSQPEPRPKQPFSSLHLEAVSLTYPDAATPALNAASVTLNKGEIIGLIGPSGAGKTTLADVILGILPPDTGHIRINDAIVQPGEHFPLRLSYIPQDVYLINTTLRRNIAFGVEESAIDEDHLHACIQSAFLDQVIKDLPHGLDTLLGERGIGLSGGQRQRVALARALYNKADIMVLDEATSALDAESEAKVTAAIHGLRGKTTCVVIAHRLSTVQDCDRLYYMDGGKVIASGTFSGLAETLPELRRMVQLGQTGILADIPAR